MGVKNSHKGEFTDGPYSVRVNAFFRSHKKVDIRLGIQGLSEPSGDKHERRKSSSGSKQQTKDRINVFACSKAARVTVEVVSLLHLTVKRAVGNELTTPPCPGRALPARPTLLNPCPVQEIRRRRGYTSTRLPWAHSDCLPEWLNQTQRRHHSAHDAHQRNW